MAAPRHNIIQLKEDHFAVTSIGYDKACTVNMKGLVIVLVHATNCSQSSAFKPIYCELSIHPQLASFFTFTAIHNTSELVNIFGRTRVPIENTPSLFAFNNGIICAKFKTSDKTDWTAATIGLWLSRVYNAEKDKQSQTNTGGYQKSAPSTSGRGSYQPDTAQYNANMRMQQQPPSQYAPTSYLEMVDPEDPEHMLTPHVDGYAPHNEPWTAK